MKLGIISDIHGDYAALKTALDRLDNVHQVDRILCAGDLVGRGPQPNEVVSLIREREIVTVRGNHDEWFYNISDGNAEFLKSLPLDWQGEFEGCSLYMCHGKPGNNIWGLYRDHLSNTLLNMMLDSLHVDVLITGHTHAPMYVQVEQGCLINPGSLFQFKNTRSSSHTYGVLHLPDVMFELFDLAMSPYQVVPCES
ncbi:MAG TPA: metallophosphoesterase family protein [Spirillospora sp.]|nr:metallophosphoesterase family protein [Spirillospora sp.]